MAEPYSVTVKINHKLGEVTRETVQKGVKYTATDLKAKLKKNAPVNKESGGGKLQGSIEMIPRGPYLFEYIGAKYLKWVNDGTGLYGPHATRIVPVHSKFLYFEWKGRMWCLRSVKGQKGQKFVEKSMQQEGTRVQEFMNRAVLEAKGIL